MGKEEDDDGRYTEFIIGILVIIIAFIIYLVPNESIVDESTVTAIVTDKEFNPTYYYLIGTTIGYDDEEYLITVDYEDITTTFDNATLYNAVNIGDTIQVNLYTYYDENGNVERKVLRLK